MRRLLGSVRMRTTLAATAVLALALAVAAASLLVLVRRALLHDIDETAELRATDIASLIVQGDLPTSFAGVEGNDEALVQVVDRNGRVLAASAPLAGRPPVSALDPGTEHILTDTDEDLRIGRREGFRVSALEVPSPEGRRTVYVLTSLVLFRESVHTVRRSILIGIPLLIVVVGGVTWLFVGRALRPVEVIRRRVRRISEASLAERVPVPPTNDEIARLASTMNEMLARLEASSTRQRQFVADASHELRTPLAAASADLEVALGQPVGTDWPATAEDVLAQLRRLERLQHDLLFLARSGDGTTRPPPVVLDLDDVVLEEVTRLRVPEGVRVDATAVSGACVQGRRGELSRVVRNLLDNAGRFARSEVRVSLGEDDGVAHLVVEDDGPGIPESAREDVFERFTKVHESREDGGGAGLGLSIVAEIVRAHGGSVSVGSASPGARVVVALPATGQPDLVPAALAERASQEDEREDAGARRGA